MANKLKIYMCSGVGSPQDTYRLWLDGTNTATNTQAVNMLLVRINSLLVDLDYLPLSKAEQLQHYNDLDLYVIALQMAKQYAGQDAMLMRAGRVLQQFISDGKFNYQDITDSGRGDHLDSLHAAVNSAVSRGEGGQNDGEFIEWWNKAVIPYNRQGFTPQQQAQTKQFVATHAVSGVGDINHPYGDITDYIYNSGEYFLYLFIPTTQAAKLPLFLQEKIKKQREVYDYVKKVFTSLYGTEDTLQELIRTNIKAQFKQEPEKVVSKLIATRGIGDFGVGEIIAIITLVISVVISVLEIVLNYCAQVTVAKYAIPENIEDGIAGADDWGDQNSGNKKKLLKVAAIIGVIYLILK